MGGLWTVVLRGFHLWTNIPNICSKSGRPRATRRIPRTSARATMTAMAESFLVDVPDLHPGVPYACAAAPPAGYRPVFTAGACPLDARGRVAAPGDVAAQAALVMDHLETALRAAGAELGDPLR